MRPDSEYRTDGGWKVHLRIGDNSYDERAGAVSAWLLRNFDGTECIDWKHLCGGTQHEKDFTIYLGSYATMMAFVEGIENDSVIEEIDPFMGGNGDRIVGDTGKIGARFDPRGAKAGHDWLYGWNGIPFTYEDKKLLMYNRISAQDAAERSRRYLQELFGDYFLPAGIE